MGKRNEGKAIFAVAHTMIVIIWHVLNDHAPYDELGGDYFDHRDDTAARRHVNAGSSSDTTSASPPQPDHHQSGSARAGLPPRTPRA